MDLPRLSLKGIMTYPSHVRAKPFIQKTVELFLNAGLPCPMISGGGTGGEAVSKEIGCTETRSGSYVYIDLEPDFPSGTNMQYQSCGIAILGDIVERIEGISLSEFLHREIFQPLGMNDTSLGAQGFETDRIAHVNTADIEMGGVIPVSVRNDIVGTDLCVCPYTA